MNNLVSQIEDSKIIAIVRGIEKDKMSQLFKALLEGGVKHAEITLNTENALESILKMNELYGEQMSIGAGTVLDEEMAEEAIKAGAKFLVSPNLDRKVIETAIKNDVVPLPGVMTPTEVALAVRYGAPMVKVFPSNVLGPRYIKELKGPYDSLKAIAVGGMNLQNARSFIEAGAVGIGIGGSLIDKKAIANNDFEAITSFAKELIKVVNGL